VCDVYSLSRNADPSGGLSYLSDLYGLVCDNVVNFEVCFPTRAQAHGADSRLGRPGKWNNR